MSPTAMPTVSEPLFNGYTTLKDTLKSHVSSTSSSEGAHAKTHQASRESRRSTLLNTFLEAQSQLESFKHGKAVEVDGTTLSIPAVVAVARYGASAALSDAPSVRDAVLSSRRAIEKKVEGSKSVYGVSTGFGGSADTRTSHTLSLGSALLQHQHAGILPVPSSSTTTLPLLDPLSSTSMPEAWVRGAILIRMNSLIRGHSGVRWELIEKMGELLHNNITPLVPMRGSISASGDLSPLSYIAGTLIGNPAIRVYHTPTDGSARRLSPSSKALPEHGVQPLTLQSKEHLGILNGTAFSAATAALVLHDAAHLALLAQACTALGVEALLGTRASFDPFIHAVARPHPGQVEAADSIYRLLEGSKFAEDHEEEVALTDDKGTLRQDRYPLRTAPQYLGPQLEDILSAIETVTQECNSTTDNPLIDGKTGQVHHGGNFQAMAVTSATEKARLALFHLGKLLFAQSTELLNPAMNRGLPPSLAATDPSLNYHGKGVDIATAAYVSELGFLASPVSTHVQSAEMHNQAVNSLALISARKTIDAVQVLSILSASYLYLLCQALDLRALQREFSAQISHIISEELADTFAASLGASELNALAGPVTRAALASIDHTSTMDAVQRMEEAAGCAVRAALEHLTSVPSTITELPLAALQGLKARVASRAADALIELRRAYLAGEKGPTPASEYLRGTRGLYEFVRVELGVKMHGSENMNMFEDGLGVEDVTIGENISVIYEAIRDGRMHSVVASLFA